MSEQLRAMDERGVALAVSALREIDGAVVQARLFRLLGDPTRVRVLYALRAAGELCVSDLVVAVDAPQPKISQGLRLLREAGVVLDHRIGKVRYYSLSDRRIQRLLDECLLSDLS